MEGSGKTPEVLNLQQRNQIDGELVGGRLVRRILGKECEKEICFLVKVYKDQIYQKQEKRKTLSA